MIPAYNNLQHFSFVAPRYGPSPRFRSLHSEQDWASEKTCPTVFPLEWSQVQKKKKETHEQWKQDPDMTFHEIVVIMVCYTPYINWARFHPLDIHQITRVWSLLVLTNQKMQNQKMEARTNLCAKEQTNKKITSDAPHVFLHFFVFFKEKPHLIQPTWGENALLKTTKNVIQCGNSVIANVLRDLTWSFSFLEVWSQHRILTLQPDDDDDDDDDDDIDATP